ncbi:MAG: hypothetical protein ABMA25_21405 [Ilumatobacteraceae bacterium]
MRLVAALTLSLSLLMAAASPVNAVVSEPLTPLQPDSVLQHTVQNRLYDSRANGVTVDGLGIGDGKLVTNVTRQITVAGRGGVDPASAAVVFNVTVTGATTGGDLRLWPCAAAKPTAIALAYGVGDNVANSSIVAVGAGKLCAAATSPVHLILDVTNQFGAGSGFVANQKRLVNTSTGFNGRRLAANTWTPFDLPMPANDSFLNVTAFGSKAAGFVTVQSCDPGDPSGAPATSTVNFGAGERISNLAALWSGRRVCVYSSVAVDLYLESVGWFPVPPIDQPFAPPSNGGATLPSRIFDSRAFPKTLQPGVPEPVFVSDLPLTAAVVVVNITVVRPAAAGYVTAYDCEHPGTTSTVNFRTGTRAHLALVSLSDDRSICFRSSVATGLLVDLTGWYSVADAPLAAGYVSSTGCGDAVNPATWSVQSHGSVDYVEQLQLLLRGGTPPYTVEFDEPFLWRSSVYVVLWPATNENVIVQIAHPALAPGVYPVVVTVSDAAGASVVTDLSVVVVEHFLVC